MNVFYDAGLFLNRFDDVPGVVLGLGDAQFIRLNERELRRSVFLDHRELDKPLELSLTLDQFTQQAEESPRPENATSGRFAMIYHSAFCCSTYLARCLDACGMGRSLKEPYALTQISFYHADETYQQFNAAPDWDRFLSTAVAFLSRPGKAGRLPVIKTHNFSIVLAGDIARLYPDRARSLFIYSDLNSFLISTLKSAERRNFCQLLLRLLTPAKTERLGIPWEDPAALSEAQAAAYCWLMHMAYYQRASSAHGKTQFCSLDCTHLLDQPVETLLALAHFFGLKTDRAEVTSGLEDQAMQMHSKNPAKPFSAETRRSSLQTDGFRFRKEIKDARRWFDSLPLRDELCAPPAHPLSLKLSL